MIIDNLKSLSRNLILLSFAAILAVAQLALVHPANAAVNAQFSLTPASQSVTVGSDVVFNLDLNTGGNSVLAWKTTINYPTINFSSVTVATQPGSHFTLNPGTDVATGGVIKIARYATSASSTSGTVAKITLRSIAAGNTALSFVHACSPPSDPTPCSAITNSAGTNLISGLNGGTVAISAVPVGGTSSSAKPKTKSTSAAAPKTPAAAVTEVVQALSEAITPSATKSTNTDRSTVKLVVLDQKSHYVEGAKVTLEGISAQTNKLGEAVITDLLPGQAEGEIVYKDQKQSININVESGTTSESPQLAKFTFQIKGSGMSPVVWAVPFLAILGVVVFVIVKRRGGTRQIVTIIPDKKPSKVHKKEVLKPVIAEPAPIKVPEPVPEPKPEPIPEPTPIKVPEPVPVIAEPAPIKVPEPVPEPKPEPIPEPTPEQEKPKKIESIKTKLGFIRHKPLDPGTIIKPTHPVSR